ncbi:unnamed protein product [Lactuca virosa]|uniref:Uncharacterized protein n=1 Tax=Lactuca virosa TaxID=75947 RepID=A0AAU9NEY0_9ASTR|nr:unnamed protein product [Lactuca virosa]
MLPTLLMIIPIGHLLHFLTKSRWRSLEIRLQSPLILLMAWLQVERGGWGFLCLSDREGKTKAENGKHLRCLTDSKKVKNGSSKVASVGAKKGFSTTSLLLRQLDAKGRGRASPMEENKQQQHVIQGCLAAMESTKEGENGRDLMSS